MFLNNTLTYLYKFVRARKDFACCAVLLLAFNAVANPLQESHEAELKSARQVALVTTDTFTRRMAIEKEVAALNSLGRSAEALQRLDLSDAAVAMDRRTVDLRAKVLLSLDRCSEAMVLLDEIIGKREAIDRKLMGEKFEPGGYVIGGTEDLITAAYCLVRDKKFDKAVQSLSRVIDPFDPTTRQYTVTWYTALRAAGARANARMDKEAQYVSLQPSGHAVSLAVAQKRLTIADARLAIARLRLDPAAEQDALAELVFFHALVDGQRETQSAALEQLNTLAPYGSAEWLLAKYLFKP